MGCSNTKSAKAAEQDEKAWTAIDATEEKAQVRQSSKRVVTVEVEKKAIVLDEKKDSEAQAMQESSVQIQAVMRGKSERKQLEAQKSAAAQIQAAHRGKSCRGKLDKVSQEHVLSVKEARKSFAKADSKPAMPLSHEPSTPPRRSVSSPMRASGSGGTLVRPAPFSRREDSPESAKSDSPPSVVTTSEPPSPMMLPTGQEAEQRLSPPTSPTASAEPAALPPSTLSGSASRVRIIANFDPNEGRPSSTAAAHESKDDGKAKKDAKAKEHAKAAQEGVAEPKIVWQQRMVAELAGRVVAQALATNAQEDDVAKEGAHHADAADAHPVDDAEPSLDNEWLQAHLKLKRTQSLKRVASEKGKGSSHKRKSKGGSHGQRGSVHRSSKEKMGIAP